MTETLELFPVEAEANRPAPKPTTDEVYMRMDERRWHRLPACEEETLP